MIFIHNSKLKILAFLHTQNYKELSFLTGFKYHVRYQLTLFNLNNCLNMFSYKTSTN